LLFSIVVIVDVGDWLLFLDVVVVVVIVFDDTVDSFMLTLLLLMKWWMLSIVEIDREIVVDRPVFFNGLCNLLLLLFSIVYYCCIRDGTLHSPILLLLCCVVDVPCCCCYCCCCSLMLLLTPVGITLLLLLPCYCCSTCYYVLFLTWGMGIVIVILTACDYCWYIPLLLIVDNHCCIVDEHYCSLLLLFIVLIPFVNLLYRLLCSCCYYIVCYGGCWYVWWYLVVVFCLMLSDDPCCWILQCTTLTWRICDLFLLIVPICVDVLLGTFCYLLMIVVYCCCYRYCCCHSCCCYSIVLLTTVLLLCSFVVHCWYYIVDVVVLWSFVMLLLLMWCWLGIAVSCCCCCMNYFVNTIVHNLMIYCCWLLWYDCWCYSVGIVDGPLRWPIDAFLLVVYSLLLLLLLLLLSYMIVRLYVDLVVLPFIHWYCIYMLLLLCRYSWAILIMLLLPGFVMLRCCYYYIVWSILLLLLLFVILYHKLRLILLVFVLHLPTFIGKIPLTTCWYITRYCHFHCWCSGTGLFELYGWCSPRCTIIVLQPIVVEGSVFDVDWSLCGWFVRCGIVHSCCWCCLLIYLVTFCFVSRWPHWYLMLLTLRYDVLTVWWCDVYVVGRYCIYPCWRYCCGCYLFSDPFIVLVIICLLIPLWVIPHYLLLSITVSPTLYIVIVIPFVIG